jgi:hypothetical protein
LHHQIEPSRSSKPCFARLSTGQGEGKDPGPALGPFRGDGTDSSATQLPERKVFSSDRPYPENAAPMRVIESVEHFEIRAPVLVLFRHGREP